jgi:hypothetical protein
MMERTSHLGRFTACLPGALALCAAALLGGCVVAPYYDAYGNPVAPVAVAPAPAYGYDYPYPYPYSYPYYYGPAYYPAPVFGSVWLGGCWGCHGGHGGWGGRGRGGGGGHGGRR